MNAKRAKKFRQLLRSAVAQQAETSSGKVHECLYQENTKNRKTIMVPKGAGADETEEVIIAVGTVTVVPTSVRGVYKKMKNPKRRV